LRRATAVWRGVSVSSGITAVGGSHLQINRRCHSRKAKCGRRRWVSGRSRGEVSWTCVQDGCQNRPRPRCLGTARQSPAPGVAPTGAATCRGSVLVRIFRNGGGQLGKIHSPSFRLPLVSRSTWPDLPARRPVASPRSSALLAGQRRCRPDTCRGAAPAAATGAAPIAATGATPAAATLRNKFGNGPNRHFPEQPPTAKP
jgi:hypothetical protein